MCAVKCTCNWICGETIGLDRAPKVSMGGFRVTPDFTVADYPRDAGLLLPDRRDSVAGAEK